MGILNTVGGTGSGLVADHSEVTGTDVTEVHEKETACHASLKS